MVHWNIQEDRGWKELKRVRCLAAESVVALGSFGKALAIRDGKFLVLAAGGVVESNSTSRRSST